MGRLLSAMSVATVAAVVVIPTIATAHGGNSDANVVHACIGNVSKIVRIVGVSGVCLSSPPLLAETPVHWSIQGPQGPAGANGANGTNGINGKDGTDGHDAVGAARAAGPCFDNTNRYVDCGNGTVTDTVTGLIWLKTASCFEALDWAAANQAAAAMKDGDCSLSDRSSPGDWRLPTKDEWLATIARGVAMGCTGLARPPLTNDAGTACYGEGSTFSGVGTSSLYIETGFFWSSSSDEVSPDLALVANFLNGFVNTAGYATGASQKAFALNHFRIWPVRRGSR